MEVRHQAFMAMADAFLGRDFDREKLTLIASLQRQLQETQTDFYRALTSHCIDRAQYVDAVNELHTAIAGRCESILGAADFKKLFGMSSVEIGSHIDRERFLAQA